MKIDDRTAVSKALTTLRRIGVDHCVIYEGVTYGNLTVAPPPQKKYRVYDLKHLYLHILPNLQMEQEHTFERMDVEKAERLRSSVSAKCYALFGPGKCETKLNRHEDGTASITVRRLFELQPNQPHQSNQPE